MQGDSFTPILFNIALEKVIREMNMGQHEGVNLQDHTIGLLAYADDLVLITESQNELKSLFRRLEKSSAKIGLRINEEKTKYMVVRRQNNARLNQLLRIDQYNFGKVEQFKYLGTILTQNNDTAKEIEARILAGNKCFFGLGKLLRARSLSRDLKKQLYTILIRSVVMYGAETWTIRKTDENRLLSFERKILRRIF